jgi:hypothetical protein
MAFKKTGDNQPIKNIIILDEDSDPKNHEMLSQKLKKSLQKAKEQLENNSENHSENNAI